MVKRFFTAMVIVCFCTICWGNPVFALNNNAVVANTSSSDNYDQNDIEEYQRDALNMLNYMMTISKQINDANSDQMLLESIYNSLANDIKPSLVDGQTKAQISNFMNEIAKYRMINEKRNRIEYIYDQGRAQSFKDILPNPLGLLSAVQSGNMLKNAASVLYMGADSFSRYSNAISQIDQQFIQNGWELDDEARSELHESTKNMVKYIIDTVQDYDLPDEFVLTMESIDDFVSQTNDNESYNAKIVWLENRQDIYGQYGAYWLELAKDYYNTNRYADCLKAVNKYNTIGMGIRRKDIDYATILPMAIVAAKETKSASEYVELAEQYCNDIIANTKDENWELRYFVAQIYLDLYSVKNTKSYLEKAYGIAVDNIVVLLKKQKEMNVSYQNDIEEIKLDKINSASKKKEIKEYNELIKEERKKALPPVNEALYLNCELLFDLADKMQLDKTEQNKIDAILHENNKPLFLTKMLDNNFWFAHRNNKNNYDNVNVSFNGKELYLPVTCLTEQSAIKVKVSGTELTDWKIDSVKRPKGADISDFTACYKSENAKKYSYKAGDRIIITVFPMAESTDQYIEFKYDVVPAKIAFLINTIKFERVTK